jgi:hypothetical protein
LLIILANKDVEQLNSATTLTQIKEIDDIAGSIQNVFTTLFDQGQRTAANRKRGDALVGHHKFRRRSWPAAAPPP